jgi:cytochrome c553
VKVFLALLATPFLAHAQADLEAGKAKVAQVCAACHGANGVSVTDAIPNLAGQKALYIENQLKAFKDGVRKAPSPTHPTATMAAIATQLSPADMTNVAAFFASQPGASQGAKSAQLPNLAKSNVAFPDDYKQSFVKYHTINFPATRQVRHYYANKVAIDAAEGQQTAARRLVPLRRGVRREAGREQAAGDGQGRFLRAGEAAALHRDAERSGLGQGFPGHAAQCRLELRDLLHRQAAPADQSGGVPGVPQAARRRELRIHAEAARRGRQVAA